MKYHMTYDDSIRLARKLKRLSPAIKSIELFGSVLRKGHGRDADFLILVDEELATRWWSENRKLIRVKWPYYLQKLRWIVKKFFPFAYATTVRKLRRDRLINAADILGISLQTFADHDGNIPDFEMFLMPLEWRNGGTVNLEALCRITDLVDHKNTIRFLERIAKEARKIA